MADNNLKKQIIEEAKLLAEDKEPEREPVYPDFILDTSEGLFVVFPELQGENISIKKVNECVYFFQISENYFYFPSEEVWRQLLNKKFISFCVLPYMSDEKGDIYRSFAGMEVVRIDLSGEDKKLFENILEEIEKEKIKKEAQKELIEKLRKLGLSEKDIEKALVEN